MLILRRYLPFFIIPVSIALALLCAGGCSSTTTVATDDGTVTMQSQLTGSHVDKMEVKGDDPQSGISSLVVTQVRLFISDIKLHREKDSTNKDEREIKTGPMVVTFDSLGSHVVTSATVPAGTYEKIKFELHHPNDKDAADAALLAQYPEFTSGNQHYTIVITGYTVTNGVQSNFTAYSNASHNYEVKFKKNDGLFMDEDHLIISGGTTTTLGLQFDPRIVFHLSGGLTGTLFDPRDGANQNTIDLNVVQAIRIVKIS
jgi:hypothetical protein